MQEKGVQSLYWEDLLERETVTHSSILAWEIPWTEEPNSPWSPRVRHDLATKQQLLWFTFTLYNICFTAEREGIR